MCRGVERQSPPPARPFTRSRPRFPRRSSRTSRHDSPSIPPWRNASGRRYVGLAMFVALAAGWLGWLEPDYRRVPVRSLQDLEREFEALRTRSAIPGMSAAIAEGGRIIWARGFGMANKERAVPAEADTIYGLASLTKPYGATVVLQLVQEGRLRLDDEVSRFGIAMARSAPVTVKHLLSHTSGDPPGAAYRYDGNAFGALTQIVERATGQPFAKALADRIIRPLGLTRTRRTPAIRSHSGRWSRRSPSRPKTWTARGPRSAHRVSIARRSRAHWHKATPARGAGGCGRAASPGRCAPSRTGSRCRRLPAWLRRRQTWRGSQSPGTRGCC